MTLRQLEPKAVQCARRLDGHDYQRLHREYNFSSAFNIFKSSENWEHLSILEAMATMSLIEKALQLWTSSSKKNLEQFDRHFEAFHNLYELLKDVDVSYNT